jgi:hypothetical protein
MRGKFNIVTIDWTDMGALIGSTICFYKTRSFLFNEEQLEINPLE